MGKVFLTVLFVIMATTAFSQITIKPGVRAGVNFSNVTSSNSNFDTNTDFYIGVFTEINFTSFYALQPELNYTRQGANSNSLGQSDIEIQYLSLAVANKFSPFKVLKLHFIAGPAINIKVGDNLNNSFTGFEFFNRFDVLVFGGIGYSFPFNLSVEARYNIGLEGNFDENFVDNDNGPRVNEVIQIGATYKFDF
ncbi:porin family protein [Dokdonia sp.]|uniref:porin family protein n=1 Tax=Dokdonia sp. TaxID=2024995 RepID=UPI00326566D8